ncbi:hypothetical protein HWV62_3835 [Athelia sp. TMB]|nr:hypothetical protein HWV62_3835 [Athelia sp. TMB]
MEQSKEQVKQRDKRAKEQAKRWENTSEGRTQQLAFKVAKEAEHQLVKIQDEAKRQADEFPKEYEEAKHQLVDIQEEAKRQVGEFWRKCEDERAQSAYLDTNISITKYTRLEG